MSVEASFELPAQPSSGLSQVVPLGGDGYRSPFMQYDVVAQLAGDASGGNARITCSLDRRFSHLVATVQMAVTSAAADVDCAISLAVTDNQVIRFLGIAHQVATTIVAANATLIWVPPPLMIGSFQTTETPPRPHVQCSWPNANGTTFEMTLIVYEFNINARQATPLEVLTAVKPSAMASSTP